MLGEDFLPAHVGEGSTKQFSLSWNCLTALPLLPPVVVDYFPIQLWVSFRVLMRGLESQRQQSKKVPEGPGGLVVGPYVLPPTLHCWVPPKTLKWARPRAS